jgi:hypothetical protein
MHTGTANRNRTHIHSLEESCILHYTIAVLWPVRRDSNSRRLVSKTSTLPLSYGPNCLAELLGLEPRMTESKSVVLPLHYSSTEINLQVIAPHSFAIILTVSYFDTRVV